MRIYYPIDEATVDEETASLEEQGCRYMTGNLGEGTIIFRPAQLTHLLTRCPHRAKSTAIDISQSG